MGAKHTPGPWTFTEDLPYDGKFRSLTIRARAAIAKARGQS